MAATLTPNGVGKDNDVEVTFEDQKMINEFACKNMNLSELQENIKAVQKEIDNAQDAEDDLLMLDDEDMVSFQIGEVFFEYTMEDTQTQLEKRKEELSDKMNGLKAKEADVQKIMKELKVKLYAKFEDNINLEA